MTNNLSGQINVPSTSAGTLTGTINTNSGMAAVVNNTGTPIVGPSAFTKGNPGTTFTPVPDQVSPHEVELSWVNDGGKPNPDTVTITGAEGPEGPRGSQGVQGVKGDTGNSGVYIGQNEPVDENINVWIDDTSGEVIEMPAASAIDLGGLKVRLDGTTLYIRNDGSDA